MKKKLLSIILTLTMVFAISSCTTDINYSTPSLDSAGGEDVVTQVTVPNFIGLTYEKALKTAPDLAIVVEKQYSNKYKKNIIMWQGIKKGTTVNIGTSIKVIVSRGKQQITIPKTKGLNYKAYKTVLESLKFKVKVLPINNTGYDTKEIVSISPAIGKKADIGSIVKIYVDSTNV